MLLDPPHSRFKPLMITPWPMTEVWWTWRESPRPCELTRRLTQRDVRPSDSAHPISDASSRPDVALVALRYARPW